MQVPVYEGASRSSYVYVRVRIISAGAGPEESVITASPNHRPRIQRGVVYVRHRVFPQLAAAAYENDVLTIDSRVVGCAGDRHDRGRARSKRAVFPHLPAHDVRKK